jgi:hypothetical protein
MTSSLKERIQGLPVVVNVLGTDYNVVYVDELIDDCPEMEGAVGETDWTSGTITVYVGEERPRSGIWQVFLHELLHALTDEMNITEITDLEHDKLERVIDNLSVGLYDTLKRNNLAAFP